MGEIGEGQWHAFQERGFLRLRVLEPSEFACIQTRVDGLLSKYPHGFINNGLYLGKAPSVRPAAPKLTDRQPTILFPNVGFLDPTLLGLLSNPVLYSLIERVVGKAFYLSNTWLQSVPPGTRRLGYHKDPRGSVTFSLLLNSVGPAMGSTCLVPETHVNSPSPNYCLTDLDAPVQGEIDLDGNQGDILFFSPEAWHGRSENRSNVHNQRLFYNFYSRSSRDTTAWADLVSQEQLDRVKAVLPSHCHHMIDIKPEVTRGLARVGGGSLRRWSFGKSTSETLIRDYFYARLAYGQPAAHQQSPDFLLPFTTRLIERSAFSHRKYFSYFRIAALRKMLLKRLRERTGRWKDRSIQILKGGKSQVASPFS